MDPGNDPGRDEYGLPPVDIQIPDDARDLDRDVQAYHRELRVRRRHMRIRRLTNPVTRHGMVIPLVAACLALTLLTGSLLTVLSGRQVPPLRGRFSPTPTRGAPASQAPQLPNAVMRVEGINKELSALAPAVLAWVPAGCSACGPILKRLASQAASAGVHIYFFGDDQVIQDLNTLEKEAGPRYRQFVVDDTNNVIARTYRTDGVTAILAHRGGLVGDADVIRGLSSVSGFQMFKARLALLAKTRPGTAGRASSPAQQPAPHAS